MAVLNKIRGPKIPSDSEYFNAKLAVPYINSKDLDTMVFNQGVRIRVYKTTWCPNRKSIDGQEHELNCPMCRGTEFLDLDCFESVAFIQGQTREHQQNPEKIGSNWEEQVVLCTLLSGVEVSYYTKIELLDYTNLYQQLVQRQETGMEILNGVVPLNFDAATRRVYMPLTTNMKSITQNSVLIDSTGKKFLIVKMVSKSNEKYLQLDCPCTGVGVPSFDSTGLKIYLPDVDRLQFKATSVEALIDEENNRYYEGEDFTIDRNGDIEWLDCGSRPDDKQIYTIIYNTLVAYRAIRALHSNRYLSDQIKKDHIEAVEAPQQWMLKKLYLFKKEDSESGVKLENNRIFAKGE